MTAFCSYTVGESRTPLIYRFVYDVLSNAVPHTHSTGADTTRRWYLRVSGRPAVALLQPRSYNPWGSYLGSLGATGREKWSLASLGVKSALCHAPCEQVCCPVGIWNCHPMFPWCMATASPSAVLHDNSCHSLSFQVAQKTIPYTRVSTPQQIPLYYACAERRAFS